jgi:aspartate aminotransferase
MYHISQRVQNLLEPEMALMSQRCSELRAQGKDIINLSLGEPDFSTPDHIKEAAIEAVKHDYSHYPPISGYPLLKQAIVDKLKRENGLAFESSQIVISTGAKQALANVILCLINPGDEVIIPTPYWATYIEMVKLAQGESVIVKTSFEQNFKMTALQLEEAITPQTRVLILNSPSNPSGVVYNKDELMELVSVLQRYPHVTVVSDEIYELISFGGCHTSIAGLPGMKNRVVIINGVSKGYAMTGWRIGFSASTADIAKACIKIQSQYTSGACSISQMAALAAYTGAMEPSLAMRDAFKQRRDLIMKKAEQIPGFRVVKPEGAFYLFPDVSLYFGKSDGLVVIHNAKDLSMYLLDKAMVATVAGDAFGEPACLRISYAASEEDLVKAMDRIKVVLKELS